MNTTTENLRRLLREHREGLSSRRNRLQDYLPFMGSYFRAIKEGRLDDVPPPICVQMQLTTRCGTQCKMCEHWKERRPELSTEEWLAVLRDVAAFGVRTIILSGGEPLEREDIGLLLHAASAAGLRIGLLTSGSGTMVNRPDFRDETVAAIAETVDWVAVSIDGTAVEDQAVRNPRNSDRRQVLVDVCSKLKEKKPSLSLSATVTLQKANIGMDLERAVRFIHDEIGIKQVNFKLATGARETLDIPPSYLLSVLDVDNLLHFVRNDSLQLQDGNNLDYLWRVFEEGLYEEADVADGVPLRSFYTKHALRCFTPFVFSMIDCDGVVYPCCHLYRDNHGRDSKSKKLRKKHALGSVLKPSKSASEKEQPVSRFAEVWNGPHYFTERRRLETVQPAGDFAPCGECTRHCQHNLALNKVYALVGGDHTVIDDHKNQAASDGVVWF